MVTINGVLGYIIKQHTVQAIPLMRTVQAVPSTHTIQAIPSKREKKKMGMEEKAVDLKKEKDGVEEKTVDLKKEKEGEGRQRRKT